MRARGDWNTPSLPRKPSRKVTGTEMTLTEVAVLRRWRAGEPVLEIGPAMGYGRQYAATLLYQLRKRLGARNTISLLLIPEVVAQLDAPEGKR